MKTGISVGADSKTVETLGKFILGILKSGQDQDTMKVALSTLEKGTTIHGVSISSCTISG